MDKKIPAVKKAAPFLVPVVIWLAITALMALEHYVVKPLFYSLNSAMSIIGFLIYFILQIVLVRDMTVIASQKLDFGIKSLVFSLPVMYALFAVYTVPTLYLFVFTGKWGWLGSGYQMNRFLAAFWLTLQYGIIMLITLIDRYNKKPISKGE